MAIHFEEKEKAYEVPRCDRCGKTPEAGDVLTRERVGEDIMVFCQKCMAARSNNAEGSKE